MPEYAAERYPHIERHVSLQASATQPEAVNFYHRHFAVLCVLSMHQVRQLARVTPVPLEIFAFGSLCIMAEGRCYLSSYLILSYRRITEYGRACSPARYVRWQQTKEELESRLSDVLAQSDKQRVLSTLARVQPLSELDKIKAERSARQTMGRFAL